MRRSGELIVPLRATCRLPGVLAASCLLLLLTACASGEAPDTASADPLIRIDPAVIGVGDTLAGLAITQQELTRDSEGQWVGTVRFAGEVTLTGRYHPHFDFPEVRATCFEADDSSAVRLPRVDGDDRRVWFCFDNADEVARSLGPPGTSGDATIVIDSYTTNRYFTDAVDGARLVRVIARAPEGSAERGLPPDSAQSQGGR